MDTHQRVRYDRVDKAGSVMATPPAGDSAVERRLAPSFRLSCRQSGLVRELINPALGFVAAATRTGGTRTDR